MDFSAERREVAYFMRRLYQQQLTTTSGGNISLRLTPEMVAITPSALDKARTRSDQIALIKMDGSNLTPELKPSIETEMHLMIMRENPRVQAIVHAHPVTASAFTATSTTINCEILAESYAILKKPLMAPYACMGTTDLAASVAEVAHKTDCVLMKNHGVVALGESLLQAFDRLELIEAAARMTLVVRQLDGLQPLSPKQRDELDGMMGRTPDE